MSVSAGSGTTTTPLLCPTSLRYDEPHEGGPYCAGTARTEVLQSCCAKVGGRYECMKNKCYMPIPTQKDWRACIQTEVFVCTTADARRIGVKAKLLALGFALGIALSNA